MNRLLLIFTSLLFFCACNNSGNHKHAEILSDSTFLQDVSDRTKTTKQILDKFLPGVLAFAKADTVSFYYGNFMIDDDSIFRLLSVGKLIDTTMIIATEINLIDTMINFYQPDGETWKLIGSGKTNIPVFTIEFEDLNGDDKNEVITSTGRNMNGNTWKEVYCYSAKANAIRYAGSFSSDYEIKKDKKQIEETYEGSWYMDNSKTLYEWRQEMLVPIKQIILANDTPVREGGKLTFEYYENPTSDMNGLKLKFKEAYNSDNKKQQQLWDNFFITNESVSSMDKQIKK